MVMVVVAVVVIVVVLVTDFVRVANGIVVGVLYLGFYLVVGMVRLVVLVGSW